MTAATAPSSLAQRQPRHWWWLKRIALAYVALLLACGGICLWWVQHASARLQAARANATQASKQAVAEAQAALAPETPAASHALAQAVSKWDRSADWPEDLPSIPVAPEVRNVWTSYFRIEAAALEDVHRIAPGSHPRIDAAGSDPATVAPNEPYRLIATLRQVTYALQAEAILAHADGDDGRAIERLRQAECLVEAVGVRPMMPVAMVQQSLGANAPAAIESIAMDLQVGDTANAASRSAVEALLRQLLDDAPFRNEMAAALAGNPIYHDRMVVAGLGSKAQWAWWKLGRARDIEEMVEAARGVTHQSRYDWHAAAAGPKHPRTLSRDIADQYNYTRGVPPEYLMKQMHGTLLFRHMAAVALALRLYAIDHDGQRPEALAALVPSYLPAVPLDSFGHGEPLHYLPHALQPCLYSVSDDGKDDGGSVLSVYGAARTTYGPESGRGNREDFLYYLDRPTYPLRPGVEPPANQHEPQEIPPSVRKAMIEALRKNGMKVPKELLEPSTQGSSEDGQPKGNRGDQHQSH